MLATRQTILSTKPYLQMVISSTNTFAFLAFAFLMAVTIVCSVIPLYIENQSVEKTRFILTTVRMTNYTLQTSRSLGKRDVARASGSSNVTTVEEMQASMNASIQYALEQQLKAENGREKLNVVILQMTEETDDPSNMSVTLDFLITYTRECATCDSRRQLVIFNQLCSNDPLPTPIYFFIQFANRSYALSTAVTVYTPSIRIENIIVITTIISKVSSLDRNNSSETNGSTQISNKLFANNYTLTVATTKSNYLATLDEVGTQTSAAQNDGPVPLVGAVTMYSALVQIIERQAQGFNGSNALNVTISHIILQFWYSNSTVQILIDFLINFSTSCDNQCMSQRSRQLTTQLGNVTGTTIFMQPMNTSNGQVRLWKSGAAVLYDYSLTMQVISNCSGTIARASSPMLTIIY